MVVVGGGIPGDTAALVARAILEGAVADRRSRGCHYRLVAKEEEALADLPG